MSNTTNTARKSSQLGSETDTCQTLPSSAMSDHSSVTGTPQAIRDWLMSLQLAFPASPSASPDGATEAMTAETCGQRPSSASAWYDPASRSWRTSQGCLVQGTSEPFSATWPKAGMTLDGVFYRQPRWERRISAIGSGLWPTAVAQDDNKSPVAHMAMKSRMKGGPRYKPTSLQVTVKGIEQGLWPAPTVMDTIERKEMRPSRAATNRKTGYLSEMVIFPTPTDPTKGGGSSRSGDRQDEIPSLQGMARKGMWPTPKVDHSYHQGKAAPSKGEGHGRTLGGTVQDAESDTPRATWPTIRSTDADRGGRGDLIQSVRGNDSPSGRWPTPKASASGPDYARADRSGSGGDDLATAVARETFPSPAQRDWRSGTGRADNGHTPQLPETVGGQLNADWVEWLMGWPIGWTSLEPLSAEAIEDWLTPGWWDEEPLIPRVIQKQVERKHRLMALGNGQVPLCAAVAFLLLTDPEH